MKANLFWIPGPWRGRLAIASRPRGGDWLDDEADAWRQADIDMLLSRCWKMKRQLSWIYSESVKPPRTTPSTLSHFRFLTVVFHPRCRKPYR